MTNCVNVTVMLDQVLEEGIGKDSIARKTILYWQSLDRIIKICRIFDVYTCDPSRKQLDHELV